MAVSLTLMALHVVLVLLADAIANHPGRSLDRGSQHGRQGPLFFMSEGRQPGSAENRRPGVWKHDVTHTVELAKGPPDTSPFHYCFEDKCRCSGVFADCSGNFGKLTFVPKLPADIRFLNFSNNDLRSITSDDFFLNVTTISGLDLSDNKLSHISPGAFRPFKNLRVLLMESANLTYTSLAPVLSVTTLKMLDVAHGNLGPVPDDLFHKYPMPQMENLVMSDNKIQHLNLSSFQPLVSIKVLELQRNRIMAVSSAHIPSLSVLNLNFNDVLNLPVSCSNGSSLFPRLQKLFGRANRISSLPAETCLPALRVFDLSGNVIREIPTDMFVKFPRLSVLFLESSSMRMARIQRNAFRNPSLNVLSLKYNELDLGSASVDHDAFANCPRLSMLLLSHNNLYDFSQEKFQRLFGQLPSLRYLHLDNTGISEVNASMLKSVPRLMELGLSQNRLTRIPDGTFDNLTQLHYLYLDENQIPMVTESTFGAATRQRLRHLDLSGNPFNCSADLVWFCQWMRGSPGLFNNSWSTYMCANKPHTQVTSICSGTSDVRSRDRGMTSMTSDSFTRNAYTVMIVSASLLIFVLTLTVTVMLCCARHAWLHRRRISPTTSTRYWHRLVADDAVHCPTLTHKEKACAPVTE